MSRSPSRASRVALWSSLALLLSRGCIIDGWCSKPGVAPAIPPPPQLHSSSTAHTQDFSFRPSSSSSARTGGPRGLRFPTVRCPCVPALIGCLNSGSSESSCERRAESSALRCARWVGCVDYRTLPTVPSRASLSSSLWYVGEFARATFRVTARSLRSVSTKRTSSRKRNTTRTQNIKHTNKPCEL